MLTMTIIGPVTKGATDNVRAVEATISLPDDRCTADLIIARTADALSLEYRQDSGSGRGYITTYSVPWDQAWTLEVDYGYTSFGRTINHF